MCRYLFLLSLQSRRSLLECPPLGHECHLSLALRRLGVLLRRMQCLALRIERCCSVGKRTVLGVQLLTRRFQGRVVVLDCPGTGLEGPLCLVKVSCTGIQVGFAAFEGLVSISGTR